MQDNLVTTAEVAAAFEVDISTVSRWVTSGRIPTLGKFGPARTSAIMFDRAAVADFGRQLAELHTGRQAAA